MSATEVHYERLPNGLTLLLRETDLAPVANVQIWAGVGAADERPEEAGLAHFHEHMLFKGTERRGVGEVAGEIEGAGGRVNAYTSFDVTVYYATLPIGALGIGLDVLADAVQHSIFDPDEIAREQEVVIEEIRRSQDAPGHVLSDLTFHEAYRVHPYRLPILGSEESVQSFDPANTRRFFERWYTAPNLTVVAAGRFDARELAARIAEQFAHVRGDGARRQRAAEPRQTDLRARVLRRHFEAHRVELAWPAPAFGDEDATYLDLLSYLLGECESSRLVRRVREREAWVDRIDSSSYTPLDRGLFTVSFETDEARAGHAIEAVSEEIARLAREPVSRDELERARTNFLASEHFERESVSGLASKLGSFQVLGGDWRSEARYFETLARASVEDILRVAGQYLTPEQLTASALITDKPEHSFDEETIATAVAAGLARSNARFRPPKRLPAAPRARATAPGDVIHSYALPGGGQLHVAPRHGLPLVAARAAFAGGLLSETAESAGITSFLSSMWTRGTEGRSAEGFARSVEDLGAEIDGFSGRSSLGLTLEVTSDRFLPALDLFAEALLEPGFEADEIERERRETLSVIDRREDQLAQRAYMLFAEAEFERHPYRLPMLGTRESVSAIGAGAIRAHYDRWVRSPNLSLAIAGDVDPDRTAEQLATRLCDLPGAPFEGLHCEAEPLHDGIREVEWRKDRAQAHLVIGFRGLAVTDPDRVGLEVISQLLAGQGGRLFLELRDRQSLAYTVSAMNIEGTMPGFFAVYIATSPDKTERARAGILQELGRLIQAPPDTRELEQTKRNLVGNHVIDQQRNASRAAHIALDALYGLGPAAYLDYAEQVEAIGGEDVLRIARRILRLDAYTLALVHP